MTGGRKIWHFYALLTIFLWASAYVYTKVALAAFSPGPLGFLRCAAALAALVVICFVKKAAPPPLSLKTTGLFILSGAAGFSVYLYLFNNGAGLLTASASCLIISTAPVITALGGFIIYREKFPPLAWAAMAVEFGGIMVMTMKGGPLTLNSGLAWMLGAALAISAYNLIQRAASRSHSALMATTAAFLTGTAMLSFYSRQAVRELAQASAGQIAVVIFLGLGPSAAAYLAWTKALALSDKPGAVANYMFLTPFVATVLGYLIINEKPDTATLTGGAIILSGLGLFNFAARQK
ncbi:EamA/RhaT family transporter [Deltaproteobacteria bacterium Smac51]|nr:EamA/RhaT family transporter [Deltaproteobacteria bacterium Smac51]